MKAKSTFGPMLLPALRAKMGDRWYYTATMTFGELASSVQRVDDIHEKAELKTWIQRDLRPERTKRIAEYLASQKERFFNALVIGIYGGDPEWSSVAIHENTKLKNHVLNERETHAFGFVRLSGEECLFAIDGQHRVEGIKAALLADPTLKDEEQTLIFIAHKTTSEGRERTRRLFSTLNGFAKPVHESELIALNEDDSFALATRRLIDEYPGLSLRFATMSPTANIPNHDKTCITTVISLYRLTLFLAPLGIRKKKADIKIGPSKKQTVEEIFDCTSQFWDALKANVAPIRKVMASKPEKNMASLYRTSEGGNILFRTVGLTAFARATRVLVDKGTTMEKAVASLAAKIPLELDADVWQGVFWKTETSTMLHKYGVLARNIMLYCVKEYPKDKLFSEYYEITGRDYP